MKIKEYDVLIIGGGPAGLTAALALSRIGRKVLVMDEGIARNDPAKHMNNFPSRDGTPPKEFKKLILEDLQKYKEFEIQKKRVESLEEVSGRFLANGEIRVRKVLLAHGVVDIMPDIKGIDALWGKSIYHCPYCHGHEHKGGAIGFIGDDIYAHHMAPILQGLSKDLIMFSNGLDVDVEVMRKHGIKVYREKIIEIYPDGLKLASGEIIDRECFFFRPSQKMRSELGLKLGCEITETGLYKVDENGMTTRPGIFAAGDNMEMRQSVLMACSAGQRVAAWMNFQIASDLFNEL